MGHQSASVSKASKSTALERHDRVLQRSAKRKRCLEEQLQRSVEISDNNEDECRFNSFLSDDDEESHRDLVEGQRSHRATQTNKGESKDMGCQTFLTNDDIETLLKNKKEGRKSYCKDDFKDDNCKVQFYTGLETLSVLMTIYNLVSPGLPNRECLTKFQQLLLTLMRLRLNLLVQDLAYRFCIHASTVSRTFQACIQTMYSSMHFLVHWPDRENLLLTMPMCFKENFPSCAVIMECFEVFIDRPSGLLAQKDIASGEAPR